MNTSNDQIQSDFATAESARSDDELASLRNVLDALVLKIEKHSSSQAIASILILDATGKHLRHGSAPSLPEAYCEAIDGLAIGPTVGSCGTAAFSGNIVMVRDIAVDPLWARFKDLALAHDLRACWSLPIFSSDEKTVIGTFALYHDRPKSPSVSDREMVRQLASVAAEAIESRRLELNF